MNDNEQPINPNDLIIFKNIDTEDFEWQYDAIKTPLPYYIRAGETRELPYYIARHGIEKIIDKVLMRQGKIHTSPLLRDQLRHEIVQGLRHINYIREKTPNELALEAMQRKKDSDPYKELFKEREIEAEKAATAALPTAPAKPLLETIGAPVVQPVVNPTTPASSPVVTPEATIDPNRVNVYNLLTTKLHMDLTHQKTKEKLDSMPVEQIRQEFSSELPELSNPDTAVVPDTKDSLSEDGMPVRPTTPITPTPPPAQPVTPPAPAITMNPSAPAAPLLDQQLGQ